MAIWLQTTLNKIGSIANSKKSIMIESFYEYLKANGISEKYQNQILSIDYFCYFLGPDINFFDIKHKE
jgi:hypothetical protein